MKLFRNAISPVVSVSLLIVIAVVSLSAFNTWFNTYQSDVLTKVEMKFEQGGGLVIDKFIKFNSNNASVYLKSTAGSFNLVDRIDVGDSGCNMSSNFIPDTLTLVDLECSDFISGENELVVYTSSGVYSKFIYLE